MNKKKIIATASAVALAAVLAFGGTLTYYQGQADSPVENTFVDQGNSVSISETDEDGNTTYSNTYSIIPGTTDKKDPVVTAEFTLDSYVYVKADDTTKGWIEWAIANGWTSLGDGYDGVYYMLLKTVQYDSETWTDYSYTDSETNLTYSYNSDSGVYTVANSGGTTLYTYTVKTNSNGIEVYTASIPVILNDTVTYSSEINNDTFEDYGSTVSLDFTAYIIQASLNDGTDENDYYGEKEYTDEQLAYYYVNSEDYYEAAVENGNVAAIGMNVYETLQQAITAAETGETVTLLADMELTNSTIRVEADQKISLDLGGNTITVTEAEAGRVALYNAGTITSLTNGGIVLKSLETANSNVAYVVYNLGTIGELNIDANGGAWTVYVGGTGTIKEITGGTYINNLETNVAGFGLYITTNATVGEISGGEFQGTKAAVANYGSIGTISGGLFHGRYYDGDTVTTLLPQYTIMYSGKISTITGGTFFKGSTNIAQYMNTFNNALTNGNASLVQTDNTATIVYKKNASATTTITYTGYYYKAVPNE